MKRKNFHYHQQLHSQTLKLPSYATCLKNDIKPRNYNALKDYYQIMIKDADIARVNAKQLVNEAKDHIYGTKKVRQEKSVPYFLDSKCYKTNEALYHESYVSQEFQTINMLAQETRTQTNQSRRRH